MDNLKRRLEEGVVLAFYRMRLVLFRQHLLDTAICRWKSRFPETYVNRNIMLEFCQSWHMCAVEPLTKIRFYHHITYTEGNGEDETAQLVNHSRLPSSGTVDYDDMVTIGRNTFHLIDVRVQ